MAVEGSTRAILAAFFANLGIGIFKLLGFFFTRSAALLAESVHSFADTTNQLLLLLGGRLSRRQPTSSHPFGYGNERYFWSFVVALVLFSFGGAYAIYEGVNKIRHPEEFKSIIWAVVILCAGIVLEGFSLRTAVVESNKARKKNSWATFVRKAKTPELPVVLLEDLGALIGLVIALAAILTAEFTGNYIWDGIGTLSIGILLCLIAYILSREMKSLLLGEGASVQNQDLILEAFNDTEGIDQILELRTLHIGPDKLLITAKVSFASELDAEEIAQISATVESQVQTTLPLEAEVYIHSE